MGGALPSRWAGWVGGRGRAQDVRRAQMRSRWRSLLNAVTAGRDLLHTQPSLMSKRMCGDYAVPALQRYTP